MHAHFQSVERSCARRMRRCGAVAAKLRLRTRPRLRYVALAAAATVLLVLFYSQGDSKHNEAHAVEDSAAVPDINADIYAAALPDINAAALPDINATAVPDINAAAVPDINATAVPDINAAAVPDINAAAVPDINAAALPDINAAALPDINATAVPDINAAAVPDINAAAVPDINAAAVPDINAAAVPDIYAAAGKPGYVVWSRSCQIPDMDPFHPSIRDLLENVEPVVCSQKPPLTFTTSLDPPLEDAGSLPRYVLRVNKYAVEQYVPENKSLTCCYSNVTRFTLPPGVEYTMEADNYYNVSECVNFENEVRLKPDEEFILVRCNSYTAQPNQTKEVYVNVHAVVPIKANVEERIKKRESVDNDDWYNLLLVGFDSISRLNLFRTMPQTTAYLRQKGFIDLQGYNKIGDSTTPNILAILTGYSLDQIRHGCWTNDETKLDDCPMIWKELSRHNYATAFAEDEPIVATFNYQRTGFVQQPTDYYNRPYTLVATNTLKIQERYGIGVCMGPETTTDRLFKYSLDFLTTFRNYLHFGFFWFNNFSHSDINIPRDVDLKSLKFLKKLNEIGTYNNTIVIFFSDHGMRYGKIAETYVGWLEERLPYIYIHLPHSFKKKYPEAHRNLLANRKRLTTPYDLHVTIKDIISKGLNSTLPSVNVSLACPKCKSLFAEDFGDRSCEDAGITPHWCTCTQYKEVPVNDSVVQNAARFVLVKIQKKIRNSTFAKLCADLAMSEIIKASVKVHVNENNPDYDDFLIIIETLPGGARFEATVRRHLSRENSFSIMGRVTRVNAYGNQSICVNDAQLKLYCFCLPT